ncbi:MAG: thioredoxin [Thermodesulfobacteriota bacterium]
MMSGSILLTDENFENEVTSSQVPVLVDFWAEWCGPCRTVGPIIEEIAEEYSGKLKVGKLNVDENQKSTYRYGVRSIPTLIIFKDGKPLNKIIGALPKGHIVEVIEGALSGNYD